MPVSDSSPRGYRRRRVLVVDDHADSRRAVLRALLADGYAAEAVADGITGLRRAFHIHPGVIIMEHPTYLYGGRALIESLHANVEMEDVAIIVRSSRELIEDRWLERHPCDAYLSKTTGMDELLRLVGRFAERGAEGPGAVPPGGAGGVREEPLPEVGSDGGEEPRMDPPLQ